ncbi:hypothetical protein L7F22_060384 [Adiantum nelumboides]|nr:hypothetical protein [Adiantum nelumboides]
MVGGGQLARMTAQAAVALGQTLRVLAASPDDPAARATPDVVIGDPDDAAALRELATGCSAVTFDHEGQAGDATTAVGDGAAGARVRRGGGARRRRRVRGRARLAGRAQGHSRRLRRPRRLVPARRRRRHRPAGRRPARRRHPAARRVRGPDDPRAGRERRPLALRPGRRVAGRRDPAGRRPVRPGHLARPRSRPGPRRPDPGTGAADRGRARRRRADDGRAVRDRARRGRRERAGDAPAQLRALDDRGLGHLAVRAAPARGAGLPARLHRPGRPGRGDGERARCGAGARDGHGRAAAPLLRALPRGEGAPLRQGRPPGPQDRPRDGPRPRRGRRAHPRGARRGLAGHRDLGGRLVRPHRRSPLPAPPGRTSMTQTGSPRVGVIMGSDSDWPVMGAAGAALDEFGVPWEVGVYSAHRTPQRMLDYAASAADRGLQAIVAGAGGAAHLPGMVAAATPLPVIGVPVPLKYLDGLDSLLSIVQMPAGVPVATVAVGNARNAGLLAVRILGAGDERLRQAMVEYQADLERSVLDKDAALRVAAREG